MRNNNDSEVRKCPWVESVHGMDATSSVTIVTSRIDGARSVTAAEVLQHPKAFVKYSNADMDRSEGD